MAEWFRKRRQPETRHGENIPVTADIAYEPRAVGESAVGESATERIPTHEAFAPELPPKARWALLQGADEATRVALARRSDLRESSRRFRLRLATDRSVAVRAALYGNPGVDSRLLARVARQRHLYPLQVLCAAAANPTLPASGFIYLEHDAGAHSRAYPSEQRRGQHILDQALAANPARPSTTTEALWARGCQVGAYSPDVPNAGIWVLCALARVGRLDRHMRWDLAFSVLRPDKLGFMGADAISQRALCAHIGPQALIVRPTMRSSLRTMTMWRSFGTWTFLSSGGC